MSILFFLQGQQSELLDLLGGDSIAPPTTSQALPTSSGGGALMDLLGLDVGPSVPPPSSSAGLLDLLGGAPTTSAPPPAPLGTNARLFKVQSTISIQHTNLPLLCSKLPATLYRHRVLYVHVYN